MDMNFREQVYKAVQKIPEGKVSTYGAVAAYIGRPHASRMVGCQLHFNNDPDHVPCYRVVFKDGSLSPAFAFGGANVQRAMLEDDGVEFTPDGKVKEEYIIQEL